MKLPNVTVANGDIDFVIDENAAVADLVKVTVRVTRALLSVESADNEPLR